MTQMSFLILDDNRNEREIMAHVLSEAFSAPKIRQASAASEALEICTSATFDCLLVDYNMPKVDGIAFTTQVRECHPHLPIVMFTSFGDEMLVAHALRCGVSEYIPKSRVNTESIRRTVERAIQSCALTRIIAEQREELEHFAFALAHDFKQPLRQLRIFANLISDDVRKGDEESIQKHLGFLGNAARRLSDLVDVMSQYTLLNQPPELKPFDLAGVVTDVRGALSDYLEERGAKLEFEGQALVFGNETLMGQVLQNLIVNAVNYNKSATPRVVVRAVVGNGQCVIAVSDNGIGIEPQYLAEVFRPLMRLHTESECAGTGLGLTLARKAMLAQQGEIWCESKPGFGSTFFVRARSAREDVPEQARTA